MQNNINKINEAELEQILSTEGWIQNIPKLASVGGLAASLAFGNQVQAKAPKPIKVSNVKQTVATAAKTTQTTQTTPTTVTTNKPANISTGSMFDFISQWEGLRTKMYKDHVGKPTIGIGHFLNASKTDRHLIYSLFGNTVNYDDLLKGKQQLTVDQVEKLFAVDVKIKEKLATKLIPNYNSFDQNTKNAIVNALYRGDLGPKTIKFINANDWKNAAIEYLNHSNAKSGPEQIKKRMKTNAAIFYNNSKNN